MAALLSVAAHAQDWLVPLPSFTPTQSSLHLRQSAEAAKPFTVSGECGTFVGPAAARPWCCA